MTALLLRHQVQQRMLANKNATQNKKGGNRHFGMKLHIDVDEVCGLIQSVITTAANIHDVTLADKLHASNLEILLDAGYLSIR